MDRLTKDKLDLGFFKYKHKRSPKNKKEFECFQLWLDKRETHDLNEYNYGVTRDNFRLFFTAWKGRRDPGEYCDDNKEQL